MSWRTAIGALFGLSAAAVIVWLLWDVVVVIWVAVFSLSAQIAVPLVVAVLTALVSVVTVVYSKRQEHIREIAQQQRAQKAAVYQEFMDYWFRYFRKRDPRLSEAKSKKQDEEALLTYRATVPQKIVLWASEPVTKEHNKYLRLDRTEEVTMFEFERFLFALRKDLGYSNEGLQKGDLLHLFLKGVEQRLREEEQPRRCSWWRRFFGLE